MTRWPVLIGAVGIVAFAASMMPAGDAARPETPAAGTSGGGVLPIWQSVGSDGNPDERSRPKEQYSGYRASVKSTGTVELRYNVAAVDVDPSVDGVTLGVRFRDNGSKARVRVTLHALDILEGTHETLAELDSNDYGSSPDAQYAEVDACGVVFDFGRKLYYVNATLDRQNGNGKPGLDAMQLMGLDCGG